MLMMHKEAIIDDPSLPSPPHLFVVSNPDGKLNLAIAPAQEPYYLGLTEEEHYDDPLQQFLANDSLRAYLDERRPLVAPPSNVSVLTRYYSDTMRERRKKILMSLLVGVNLVITYANVAYRLQILYIACCYYLQLFLLAPLMRYFYAL